MKNIIVPTDFSKNAYCGLHYATQLFKGELCNFIILHSFENQVTKLTSRIDIGKTEDVVDELYNTYEAKLEEVKHKIILDAGNSKHTFQPVVTSLTLFRAINKMILKEKVELVVMGGKGATASRDVFMGSNTLSMIKKIKNASLLIIPQEYDFKPIAKIAFASGFTKPYKAKELKPLLDLSTLSNACIKILHIHRDEKFTDDQRKHLHQLFDILKEGKPETNWLSDDSDNFDAITSYLHKEQIDLLAMIYYKHNIFTKLFRESTIKNLAKHIAIPFMVLPTRD